MVDVLAHLFYFLIFLNIDGQETITAGNETLADLEKRFGQIPWDDIRISAKKTQYAEKLSRAVVDSRAMTKCAVMVPSVLTEHSSKSSHVSGVDVILNSLQEVIDPNQRAKGEELLNNLRKCLQVTCGRQPRASKGGWEYRESFILDSVLYADNLRPVWEGNVLEESAKQRLGS